MRIKNALNSRFSTVVAGCAVIAVVGGGAAFAAGEINSNSIKNDSIRSVDIKNGGIKSKDLSSAAVNQLKGATGPAGPAGARGAAGSSGMAEVQTFLTELTDVGGGFELNVRPVDSSVGGTDADSPLLTFELDEGSYLIDGTAQFFDFNGGGAVTEYGVFSLLVEGSEDRGTSFTADIPNDGQNGAQSNANTFLEIPEGGATLNVVGSIRNGAAGNGGYFAGVQAIATKVG